MHDLRLIRDNPEGFDAGLAARGAEPASARILDLDEARRQAATLLQEAQSRRNEASKAVGAAMRDGDAATAETLKAEVARIKDAMPTLEAEERELGERLESDLASLPNIPAEDVPPGADESGNVEIARWGTPPELDFTPREHADLGPALGMDFETGAAMSGARFTFLRGPMARLHRALAQFMLDFQTSERGYIECAPPLLVWDKALFGTGQLPKFEDDLYGIVTEYSNLRQENLNKKELMEEHGKFLQFSVEQTNDLNNFLQDQIKMGRDMSHLKSIFLKYKEYFDLANNNFSGIEEDFTRIIDQFSAFETAKSSHLHYLIPTAEVSLTNSVREQILGELAQPIRLTALTPCFRSEAGAAGKDTRGFIRQHQFEKVELVTICAPEQHEAEHQHMLQSAQMVLEKLGLPYRTMLLCAGDMGATARKTFDLEVWLPGQVAYREISSVSWCGDYQARRMNARYRPAERKGTAFVHTLNGSGLAVGRTLVAVLENYQQADGSVLVPEALRPYTGGLTRLEPAA